MDVGAVFVAGAEPFEGVQPGEAAFDDPAVAAQVQPVDGAAAGNAQGDAASAELPEGQMRSWTTAVLSGASWHLGGDAPSVIKSRHRRADAP